LNLTPPTFLKTFPAANTRLGRLPLPLCPLFSFFQCPFGLSFAGFSTLTLKTIFSSFLIHFLAALFSRQSFLPATLFFLFYYTKVDSSEFSVLLSFLPFHTPLERGFCLSSPWGTLLFFNTHFCACCFSRSSLCLVEFSFSNRNYYLPGPRSPTFPCQKKFNLWAELRVFVRFSWPRLF